MTAIPTFHLLGLPNAEILRTLGVMNLQQILRFSFISKRCKNLVTSLQMKATSFDVSIGSSITVYIRTRPKHMRLLFYTEPNKYWGMGAYGRKKKLTAPHSVEITEFGHNVSGSSKSNLARNVLTMKDWLKHLQDFFNYHKINIIWFKENSPQFDIDDIKEEFGNATRVKIDNIGCFLFNQMVLQHFSPLQKLSLRASNFPDSKIPESILMQNFEDLEIGDRNEETISMTLDEILLINSKSIEINGLLMLPKELNKFIKLWKRGSNPRLECMCLKYSNVEPDDEEIFMRGIKYEVVSAERLRFFQSPDNKSVYQFRGGMDIYRMDGTKATIRYENFDTFAIWQMFVWFDHCIVQS